jgi:hypothetical protein
MRPPTWKRVLGWIGHSSHVEAVGAFALTYNALEFSLYGLLDAVLRQDDDNLTVYLFATLNNRQRVDLILQLGDRMGEPAAGHVRHAAKCFDGCAENRNLILHGMSDTVYKPASGGMVMVKAVKDRPGDFGEYIFPLAEIRGAAMSSYMTAAFVYDLADVLNAGAAGPTWPERPPPPRKLSLFRRPEVPEDEQPPPRSSKA